MDVEDYFIIALIFAIVAFLSNLMSSNPFNMSISSDSFILAWLNNVPQTNIYMYNTALSLFIFLPSAYFAIAFAIGGIVKTCVTFVRRATKKERKT
jgi:hypothetical protein